MFVYLAIATIVIHTIFLSSMQSFFVRTSNLVNDLNYIYDAEDALLYIAQGSNNYYPVYDGLGSIVMLRDQNGITVATYEYDDWGKLTNKTGSINSNLQFASYFWDNDAQLYHLGARWHRVSQMTRL
jgi:YD repeat-containing protein